MPESITDRPKLLEVVGLKKHFPIKKGFLFSRQVGAVKAVDGVNLFIREGETLGLVGESGCGKTTIGRLILRAYDPTAGQIWFNDRKLGRVDAATMDEGQLRRAASEHAVDLPGPLLVAEPAHDPARDRR